MPKLPVKFDPQAWDEYLEWLNRDPKITRKIGALITDIQRSPFAGIGKPEPLRYEYHRFWSRRITDEHRLIYNVVDETIFILSCHGHYDD